ncbi:MAG: general secretion pathway protein GspN [Pseudomonadota bacterium]|nr:general secretion pathway protein GspN [Xanthomonadaceae bacterium]MDE3209580.1 general secretion pathway protein GspN [Pseudomonadota bacterium]
MNAADQRRLTPFLVAGVVLLGTALLLFAGLGGKVRWGAPRAPSALPASGNPANLPTPVPLQEFAVVWQQPLFAPDRKPVAAGASSLGDLELTGVIITPAVRIALLHDRKGGREVRLRQGESTPDGSITLVEVLPRAAVFDSSSGRTELKLPAGAPIDGPKPAAPPPAGPTPPPAGVNRVMRGGFAPGRGPAAANAPPAQGRAPSSLADRLKQLRDNVEKRRAERAAESH